MLMFFITRGIVDAKVTSNLVTLQKTFKLYNCNIPQLTCFQNTKNGRFTYFLSQLFQNMMLNTKLIKIELAAFLSSLI